MPDDSPPLLGEGSGPGPALSVRGLSKTFPGTRALIGVDLELRRGEVHALVGGNGSGKSTLIKILAGVYQADDGGRIEVAGQAADVCDWSPPRAFAAGLRFVHQNPGLFLDLTVAENIAIGEAGFPTGLAGRIRWQALRERAAELIQRYHLRVHPDQPLRLLRPADRTLVAIARALQDQSSNRDGILVLDEPTTSLPETDTHLLLENLRRYAAEGQTIVYVSHIIDEVLALADRVSVLRDGRLVGTVSAASTSEAEVVRMIVGRRLEVGEGRASGASGEVVLEARGLSGGPVRAVDLELHRGEVLGIAGLLGAGQAELLRMLFGAFPVEAGELTVGGRSRRFAHPSEAIAAGIGYLPSERAAEALFASMTVRENITGGSIGRYFKGLRLRHGEEGRDALAAMSEFLIRAPSDRAPAFTLSGGNQQKMVLARWLGRRPRILLLDEPTQGVDVGSREEIYALLHAAAAVGTSVIIVSSDFAELERLCHRVAIMRRGRLVTEVTAPDIDRHRVAELAHLAEEAA